MVTRRGRRRPRRSIAGAGLAAACLPVIGLLSPALAQRPEATRALGLRPWEAYLEVEGDLSRRTVERRGTTRTDDTRRLLEGLRLREGGYVYHPRFLMFELSGLLSWQQTRQESGEELFEQNRNVRLGSYSSRTGLFRGHSGHAEWIAERSLSRVRVTDFQRREVDTRRTVFGLFWDRQLLPAELQYERSRRKHTGTGGSDQHTERTSFSGRYRRDRTTGGLGLERVRQSDERLGYSLVRDAADLHGSLFLGDWQITPALRWWRQELDVRTESTRGGAGFRGDLARGFRASGGVDLHRSVSDGDRDDTAGGRLQLAHRLYESLDTDLALSAEEQRPDGARLRTYHLGASSRYGKRIPSGRLTLFGSYGRLRRDSEGGAIRSRVIDREVRFDDADIVFLEESGIDSPSFRVVDSTATVVYLAGTDYELEVLPGAAILRRLPGGRISGGAAVRVSYDYETVGVRREGLESLGGGFGVQADVGLYFRITGTRSDPTRDVEEGSPGFRSSRLRTIEAGWTRGLWRLDWQRTRKSDRILPYERDRLSAHAGKSVGARWSWSADASRGWTDFLEAGSRFDFRSVRANVRHSLSRRGALALEVGGRDDESESGSITSWFLATRGDFRLGFGNLSAEWREESVESPVTGTSRERRIFLGIERRIL